VQLRGKRNRVLLLFSLPSFMGSDSFYTQPHNFILTKLKFDIRMLWSMVQVAGVSRMKRQSVGVDGGKGRARDGLSGCGYVFYALRKVSGRFVMRKKRR
jgi:hypothetical protein